MSYEKLFTPVTMRGITAPNRVHRTSMVSGLATEDGFVTDELIKRYEREAKGGTGTIVVEAAVVLASASPYNLRISDDRFLPGITDLVKKMREANPDVKIGVQIMQHLKLSKTGWRQKVEDFKKEDLPKIVENHVEGVKRVIKAGFDFVEIHMAHAYALSSFLSLANKRTDEYGGKQLANRMRLPIEVYQAVRKEVGENFPVGIRINGEDFCIPGSTVLQSSQIAKKFAELGADYISVSAGSRFEDAPVPEKDHPYDPMSGYSGHRMSPEFWMPDGTHVHLSEAIKKTVNEAGYTTPVIIAGKIRDPKHAEEILASGKADMIGLCRALLADPDWTVKAKEGRDKEIVKCAACNWCLEADARYEQVKCSRYPEGYTSAPDPWLPNMARPAQFPAE
ncbi:2,4-dienoyl-CoA reductase [Syntrophus gentianae]|uniref:2,4-dienoyl-CoA reductase n=1 Tax=Syntrophus gentianae TaxID=43775 RepID=A0A1H7VQ49_9BACT|nr:NADH:flavin oxidoreductase [Syntrophus gentianae]SEM11403.1 2,4-dienoyl-CoA reductase [Syntrophus gentianae]